MDQDRLEEIARMDQVKRAAELENERADEMEFVLRCGTCGIQGFRTYSTDMRNRWLDLHEGHAIEEELIGTGPLDDLETTVRTEEESDEVSNAEPPF